MTGPTYAIGVDPSLTATGIVAVSLDQTCVPPRAHLRFRATVRPRARLALPARLMDLRGRFEDVLARALDGAETADLPIAVEDPSDFRISARNRSPEVISKLGMGLGVVLEVCAASGMDVFIYGTRVWYPKIEVRRNWKHPMRKKQTLAFLRSRYPALAQTNEHETMAGGVGFYHLTTRESR